MSDKNKNQIDPEWENDPEGDITEEFEIPVPPSHDIHKISRRTYTKDDLDDTAPEDTEELALRLLNKSGYVTEEIPVAPAAASKQRKGILIAVISAAVMVVIVAVAAFLLRDSGKAEIASKDAVFRSLAASDKLTVIVSGRSVSVGETDIFLSLLQPERWQPREADDYYSGASADAVIVTEEGGQIFLYPNSTALIDIGDSGYYYSLPYGTVSEVISYLKANSTLSVADTESFLRANKTVNVSFSGITAALDPLPLIEAMKMSSWTVSSSDIVKTQNLPDATLDNGQGLRILIYVSDRAAVIEYNGSRIYYYVGMETAEKITSAITRLFDDGARRIYDVLSVCTNLYISLDGTTYRLDSGYVAAGLLSVGQWSRRANAPASLPDRADMVLSSEGFELYLYREENLAYYENEYYNIPSSAFFALSEYLTDSSSDPALTQAAVKVSTAGNIRCTAGGNVFYITTSGLTAGLGISSWQSGRNVPSEQADIVLMPDEDISLRFYKNGSIAVLVSGDEEKAYDVAPSVISFLSEYVNKNIYTELWQISASELGVLLANSDRAEVSVTGLSIGSLSATGEYFENIRDLFSALDLTPVEGSVRVDTSESVSSVFGGGRGFTMTMTPDPEGGTTVRVYGIFYSEARRVERYFHSYYAYPLFKEKVVEIIRKRADSVAELFKVGLESRKKDDLYTAIGSSAYNYSSLRFDSVSYTSTSAEGEYEFTVTGKSGKKTYIVRIGKGQSGEYTVLSMTPDELLQVNLALPAARKAEDFVSWSECEDETFSSVEEIKNRRSLAEYMLILAFREGYGRTGTESSKYVTFTQSELNAVAMRHFGLESFDATDTPLYSAERGTYVLSMYASALENRRCVSCEYDGMTGMWSVGFEWYEDPLKVYPVKSSVITLREGADGTMIIVSGVSEKK